jgi:cytochrome c-type biogenesis protein CcsB
VSSQSLAQGSNLAVYGAMVVLALAMVAFAADLALGSGRVRAATAARSGAARVGVRSAGSGAVGQDRSAVAVAAPASSADRDDDRWGRVGVSLTVLAWLLLTVALVARGLAAGRPPWGNMYEFVLAGTWWALTVFGFLLVRGRRVGQLGVVVTGACLVALGVAVVQFYVEAADLVPALKSTWLWIHVSAATLAAGVFTVGTAATVLFLLADRYQSRVRAGSVGGLRDSLARRLPDADSLDQTAYRAYAFAFPLWFFVLVSGAIWAEDAWGRYWGWDPKETWSFVTLVVFAAYLHARATAGWRGRPAALIALVGYVAFLFNFVGVNIFFSGFHSYGGV